MQGGLERLPGQLQKSILQGLFPLRCPVCDGIVVPAGEKVCKTCAGKYRVVSQPYCLKCGKKIADDEPYCRDCQSGSHLFTRGRALYEYEEIAPAIYRLKYQGRQEYASFLGQELEVQLGDFIRQCAPDAILPVPLHKNRQRKRGYNQAALLARELGTRMGIPVLENYILRTRDTQPMKQLKPKERQNNLKKAFIIKTNDVKLNTTMIVDDIYTTGATMDAMAEVLLDNGVQNVYFVALAAGTGI